MIRRTRGGSGIGLCLAIVIVLAGCATGAAPSPTPGRAATSNPASAAASSDSQSQSPGACPTAAPAPMAADQTATVSIETTKGTIVIGVAGKLGPRAAANFVALAKCGYYRGVVFHRLAPNFVIQGGDGQYGRSPNIDPAKVGAGGPGYEFADDPVTVPYTTGTVAMANAGPDTNGSQFFICITDLTQLPPNYSVFGKVTSGMDVVQAIAAMPNDGTDANRAINPVEMTTVTVSTP
jgi:peptidylprolyl isomerase/peptidyl-prolyl cis-trans isomerase B (cyclophilin B)